MYVVKDTKIPNLTALSKATSKSSNTKKKRREVLSADAQNRKIAELEGMLDSYDKSSASMSLPLSLLMSEKPQAESDSDDDSDDEVSSDDSD
jgi:hypothetical protein